MEFKVGDFVRFNHSNGSVGKVVHIRDDGPFRANPAYYVEWVYGRDIRGEIMKGSSANLFAHELQAITEDQYLKIRDRNGFEDT